MSKNEEQTYNLIDPARAEDHWRLRSDIRILVDMFRQAFGGG